MTQAPAATSSDLWATFTAKAELLGAAVVRASGEEAVTTLLRESGPIAVTESVTRKYPAVAQALERPANSTPRETVAAAEFGVAETGSLALNEPREDRAACFLADRLWLLVPRDQVVATLEEAFTRLAELTRAGAAHPLLMSGPSRTADIERVLTIGVHGPASVVAVIVDSPLR